MFSLFFCLAYNTLESLTNDGIPKRFNRSEWFPRMLSAFEQRVLNHHVFVKVHGIWPISNLSQECRRCRRHIAVIL